MANFMSLALRDQVSGGLISDKDVRTVPGSTEWCFYDYGGNSEGASTIALHMTVEELDEDGEPVAEHQLYLSNGDESVWQIEEDDSGRGIRLIPVEGKTQGGANRSTNFGLWIKSLVEAGFKDEWLADAEGKCLVFDGMIWHLNREKAPKRLGLDDDDEKERTHVVCSRVVRNPSCIKDGKFAGFGSAKSSGGGSGSKKSRRRGKAEDADTGEAEETTDSGSSTGSGSTRRARRKAGSKASKSGPSAKAVQAKAAEVLAALLEANDGEVNYSKLKRMVFAQLKSEDDEEFRVPVVELLSSDDETVREAIVEVMEEEHEAAIEFGDKSVYYVEEEDEDEGGDEDEDEDEE